MHKEAGFGDTCFLQNPPSNGDYSDIDISFNFLKYAKEVFGLSLPVAACLVSIDWGQDATPYQMGQVLLNLARTGMLAAPTSMNDPDAEVWKEELPTPA